MNEREGDKREREIREREKQRERERERIKIDKMIDLLFTNFKGIRFL